MSFFEDLKQMARKDPKIVVLPEYEEDIAKDGVIKAAMQTARDEGTAIPIGLAKEVIEKSKKIDEFVEAYPAQTELSTKAKEIIVQKPVAFAAMMVKQGYAHAMIAGRYATSALVMTLVNNIIGEQEGKIRSSIFFREPREDYHLFKLIACADMVANPNPDKEKLYRIIVTSAETFKALTGREPTIALLSYITGKPQSTQAEDPEIKKIEETLEIYRRNSHKWPIYQAQVDAALVPSVAKKKGAPFMDKPADLLIGSNLFVSNTSYKYLERLIVGGNSMIVTQGLNRPAMDLSRGDSGKNIANVIAACSVQAQLLEAEGRYKTINSHFLNL